MQSTPVVTRKRIDGRNYYFVSFVETSINESSTWSVTGLPFVGQIVHYKATLTAGTGTIIDPFFGRTIGFAADTQDCIDPGYTAAVSIDDIGPTTYHLSSWEGNGTLYGRNRPNNAAADHTVYTEFVIIEGAVP